METKLFTLYDEKTESYLPVIEFKTTGEAIRAITDLTNDVNHQFCKHASDYTLFQIGTYDNCTATVSMDKKSLGCLIEYKQQIEIPTTQLELVGGIEQ